MLMQKFLSTVLFVSTTLTMKASPSTFSHLLPVLVFQVFLFVSSVLLIFTNITDVKKPHIHLLVFDYKVSYCCWLGWAKRQYCLALGSPAQERSLCKKQMWSISHHCVFATEVMSVLRVVIFEKTEVH